MGARGEMGWGLAIAIALTVAIACGGKIEPERVGSTDVPPGASSGSTSSSSSSSSSSSGSTSSASGVGSVPCGDVSCATSTDACCSDGADNRCITQPTPPGSTGCSGATIRCDEPGDCPSEHPICCWIPRMNDTSGWSSQCVDSCIRDSISFEACATDSDCKESPGPCTMHECGDRPYRFCQQATQLCSP